MKWQRALTLAVLLSIAPLAVSLVSAGCGTDQSTRSSHTRVALKIYVDPVADFALRYDANRLTAPVRTPVYGAAKFAFIAGGASFRARASTVVLTDRNRTDRLGSEPGGLTITVVRASRAIQLPSATSFLRAERLFVWGLAPASYYLVGDLGSRKVESVTVNGLPGFRIATRWDDGKAIIYCLVRGREVFLLNSRATSNAWPSIARALNDAIRSFSLRSSQPMGSTG
jgi:hypothetical protein